MKNIWDAVSGEWVEHHEPLPAHDPVWIGAAAGLLILIWVVTIAVVWHVI